MKATIQARLTQLQSEYQQGETQLRTLLQQEATLRETLLRISGAIQVLEEVLEEGRTERPAPDAKSGPAHDGSRLSADTTLETTPDARPAQPQVLTVP
jgi:predicted nuclease with TOPRIM domain